MSDLSEFLLARFAEDERRLDLPEFVEEDSARGPGWGNRSDCPVCGAYQFSGFEPVTEEAWWDHAETVHQRTRVLAECEAKRRIVELAEGPINDLTWIAVGSDTTDSGDTDVDQKVLRLLALPYADHPDFREEWRP